MFQNKLIFYKYIEYYEVEPIKLVSDGLVDISLIYQNNLRAFID